MMHQGGLSYKIKSMYRDAFAWDLGGTVPKVEHL